jgi:hypothetical protein
MSSRVTFSFIAAKKFAQNDGALHDVILNSSPPHTENRILVSLLVYAEFSIGGHFLKVD